MVPGGWRRAYPFTDQPMERSAFDRLVTPTRRGRSLGQAVSVPAHTIPRRPASSPRRTIASVTRYPDGFDVEGPVQAEVFVVWLAGDHLELTGPCGPAPWLLELGPTDHPVEVVTRIVRDVVGEPLLVHSTSWRRDRDAVILSFVVVIDGALVGSMASLPIARSELGSRGGDGRAARDRDGAGRRAWLASHGVAGEG